MNAGQLWEYGTYSSNVLHEKKQYEASITAKRNEPFLVNTGRPPRKSFVGGLEGENLFQVCMKNKNKKSNNPFLRAIHQPHYVLSILIKEIGHVDHKNTFTVLLESTIERSSEPHAR